jgi:hypothetical protein
MATNKEIRDSNILAISSAIVFVIFIILYITYMASSTRVTESLTRENSRQWDYYRILSGSIDDLHKKVDIAINAADSIEDGNKILRESIRTELDNIELSKYAKIYDLNITICKMDEIANVIAKRTVRMKNVVGINPSVERTATTVDT